MKPTTEPSPSSRGSADDLLEPAHGADPSARPAFDPENFLPHQLFLTHRALRKLIDETYVRRFGLPDLQWRIIAELSRLARTQRLLCIDMDADKVAVNRAVQALDERGLVERRYSEVDRRSHILVLTPQGRDMSWRIQSEALALSDTMFAHLDADAHGRLVAQLRQLREIASSLRDDFPTAVQSHEPAQVDQAQAR